jgi:subtilisin family serine protease
MFMHFTQTATSFRRMLGAAVAAAIFAVVAAVPATAGVPEGPGTPPSVAAAAPGDKPARPSPAPRLLPGRYIVTLVEGADARSVAAIAHVRPTHVYEHALDGFAAELNQGQLTALRRNKAVLSIEQDQEVRGESYRTQTLDTTGQPWGLDRIDQRTGLSRTFTYWASGAYGAGYGVRAYVIDSGIATAHHDFGGRAQNLYDVFGGNGQDCHGHGTHVAGTIGGATHGVAKSVRLLGIRVLDCANRGSVGGFIAGVDYVHRYAIRPAVANMSLEAGHSSALNTAVMNLVNSGVFVAAAAGNGDINGNPLDACTRSPASASGTLTVASSDWYDTKAYGSNYGSCVDLYAPGVSVRSAWLNGTLNTISGTSMATPHVTGVAALLKSNYGDRASTTINSWILNATTTNVIRSNIGTTPNRLLFMSGW